VRTTEQPRTARTTPDSEQPCYISKHHAIQPTTAVTAAAQGTAERSRVVATPRNFRHRSTLFRKRRNIRLTCNGVKDQPHRRLRYWSPRILKNVSHLGQTTFTDRFVTRWDIRTCVACCLLLSADATGADAGRAT